MDKTDVCKNAVSLCKQTNYTTNNVNKSLVTSGRYQQISKRKKVIFTTKEDRKIFDNLIDNEYGQESKKVSRTFLRNLMELDNWFSEWICTIQKNGKTLSGAIRLVQHQRNLSICKKIRKRVLSSSDNDD